MRRSAFGQLECERNADAYRGEDGHKDDTMLKVVLGLNHREEDTKNEYEEGFNGPENAESRGSVLEEGPQYVAYQSVFEGILASPQKGH